MSRPRTPWRIRTGELVPVLIEGKPPRLDGLLDKPIVLTESVEPPEGPTCGNRARRDVVG
jgi:hypothetical protein